MLSVMSKLPKVIGGGLTVIGGGLLKSGPAAILGGGAGAIIEYQLTKGTTPPNESSHRTIKVALFSMVLVGMINTVGNVISEKIKGKITGTRPVGKATTNVIVQGNVTIGAVHVSIYVTPEGEKMLRGKSQKMLQQAVITEVTNDANTLLIKEANRPPANPSDVA